MIYIKRISNIRSTIPSHSISFFGEFKNHDFAFPFNDREIQVINKISTDVLHVTDNIPMHIYLPKDYNKSKRLTISLYIVKLKTHNLINRPISISFIEIIHLSVLYKCLIPTKGSDKYTKYIYFNDMFIILLTKYIFCSTLKL